MPNFHDKPDQPEFPQGSAECSNPEPLPAHGPTPQDHDLPPEDHDLPSDLLEDHSVPSDLLEDHGTPSDLPDEGPATWSDADDLDPLLLEIQQALWPDDDAPQEEEDDGLWPTEVEVEYWPEGDSVISDTALGRLRQKAEPTDLGSTNSRRTPPSTTYNKHLVDWPIYQHIPNTHPFRSFPPSDLLLPPLGVPLPPAGPTPPTSPTPPILLPMVPLQPSVPSHPAEFQAPLDLPMYWPPGVQAELPAGKTGTPAEGKVQKAVPADKTSANTLQAPLFGAPTPSTAKSVVAKVLFPGSPYPDMGLGEFRKAILGAWALPKVTFTDRVGGTMSAPTFGSGYGDYLAHLHNAELAAQAASPRRIKAGRQGISLEFQLKNFVVFADHNGFLGSVPNVQPFTSTYNWRDPLWRYLLEIYRAKVGPKAELPRDGNLRPYFPMDPLAAPLLDQMDYLEQIRCELRGYMHNLVIELCLRYPLVVIKAESVKHWSGKGEKLLRMAYDSGIFEFQDKLDKSHPNVIFLRHGHLNRCPCGAHPYADNSKKHCPQCGGHVWTDWLDVIEMLRRQGIDLGQGRQA